MPTNGGGQTQKTNYLARGLGLGLCFGAALGVVFGAGMTLGLAVGAGLENRRKSE